MSQDTRDMILAIAIVLALLAFMMWNEYVQAQTIAAVAARGK